MKYTNATYIKKVLNVNGFSPLKKFGQNFLIDENIVSNICRVSDIENKNVVEIGPGLGALTAFALDHVKRLVAIEIDRGFYAHLTEEFEDKSNIKIINEDVLNVDIKKLASEQFGDEPFTLMANLPYYITTACIMKFLNEDINIKKIVVMMQKEVAQRICAKAGEKGYGSLSVIIAHFGTAKIEMTVSKNCFYPRPEIDSAVISININEFDFNSNTEFIDFVRGCFKMKRKTLYNNLKSGGYESEKVYEAYAKLGFDKNIRAEQMDLDKFRELIVLLS